MFNRILAATAQPDRIDPPVLSALKLAAANRAELFVLHVLPETTGPEPAAGRSADRAAAGLLGDQGLALASMQQRYLRHKQVYDRLHFEIARGAAWKTIAETASWIGADTIVMGPHVPGRQPYGKNGLLTGTMQGVLHRANRPVLITGRSMSPRMTRMATIMACIDFSEACRLALLLAARLARKRFSKLHLLHVHGIPPFPGYTQQHYERDVQRLKHHLIHFAQQTAPGLTGEYVVTGGSQPHLEILKTADRLNVDLIVMGTHTGKVNRKWYVGSAVEKVSGQSPCPVAVIPAMRLAYEPAEE